MSHKDTVIVFEGENILITGDNGSGKSALLEAIPYALFGMTRSSTEDVVRKGETRMSVCLQMSGWRIYRGRNSGLRNGNFLEVHNKNDPTKYTGRLAQEQIDKLIKVDKQGFLLTTFFGFGENDSLLNVTAGVRMRTLQRITGIQIYEVLYKKTRERLQETENERDKVKYQLDQLGQPEDDFARAEDSYNKLEQQIGKYKVELDVLEVEVTEAEKAFNEALEVREQYKLHYENVAKLELVDSRQELVKGYIRVSQAEIDKLNDRRNELVHKLPSPLEDIDKKLRELDSKLDDVRASHRTVKEALDKSELVGRCPVCHQKITETHHEEWCNEYKSLSAVLHVYETEYKALKEREACRDEERNLVDRIIYLEDDVQNNLDKLSQLDLERMDIQEVLDAQVDLDELQRYVSDTKVHWAAKGKVKYDMVNTISTLEDQLTHCDQDMMDAQSDIEEAKRLRKRHIELQDKVKAYSHLARAYSPTGIPLELIHEFSILLSQRATHIYNQFADGQIIVENVQEGKSQGVEIKVIHLGHTKKYKELSEGQKAMVFLAVRLALTGILYTDIPPFIVLDEVSGHLSEKSMDKLLTTINEYMGKLYGKILLVSHTNVRDIFDQTLHCMINSDRHNPGVSSDLPKSRWY